MNQTPPTPAAGKPPPAETARRRRRLDHLVLLMVWKTVAITLMASGLLLVTVRLTLPGIANYKPDIERWLSNVLDVPVSIGGLRADWSGWTPELRIDDVRIVQRADGQTVARFARASFTIDPIASLKRGEIRPGNITLTGASFVVTRQRDGAITFASQDQATSAESMTPSAVLPWLLRHQRLKLRNTDVVWNDLRTDGPPLVFHDVELNARNDGERHQFEGTLSLPEDFGARLSFALDAVGNIMTPAWSGEVFLRGERVRPRMWAFVEQSLGLDIRGGDSDFEVWTTWRNARLKRAEGTLETRDTELVGAEGTLRIARGNASVSVWRSATGWDADITELRLTTASGAWPTTSASLSVALATGGKPARITGRVAYVRLSDVLPLLGSQLPLDREMVASGRFNAELSDLAFAFTPVDGALRDLQLGMQVDRLDVAPHAGLPGIASLRGRIEVAGGRGQLQLDGSGFVLEAPESLPGNLRITSAEGRLTWASAASGWQLDTDGLLLDSEDLAVRLRGSVRFRENDPSPFLRVVLQLRRGRLAALEAYLPDKLLPAPVSQWLLRSLPQGDVVDGEVLLHGLLKDFPFDGGSGRLEARLEVVGATLDYQPGWPALTALRGTVTVDGRRIEVNLDDGAVSGARIVRAKAVIEDMGADSPQLQIEGQVDGTSEQAVAFLSASPLGQDFAAGIAAVKVRGPSELSLRLEIPLGPEPLQLDGKLRLVGNSVSVTGLKKGLSGLSGEIDFTADSVTSHSLQGDYLGRPVRLDLARSKASKTTRISLRGRADRELLLAHFRNVGVPLEAGDSAGLLLGHTAGESDFIASIDVPDAGRDKGTGSPIRFEAQSSLEGVSLALPAPVGKRAAEQRLLRVRAIAQDDGARELSFAYGDVLAGRVELPASDDGAARARGVLVFGAMAGELPSEEALPGAGLVRIEGNIDALPANEWYTAIESIGERLPDAARTFAMLDQIAEIDLHVGDLRLLDYQLTDVGLAGDRAADGSWSLRLGGRDIAGTATLPPAASAKPVDIDLEHLVLRPHSARPEDGEPAGYDPRGLPGVRFVSRSLRHGELDLGRVELDTRALPDGVEITRLSVDNQAFRATGNGRWRYDGANGRAESLFNVRLDTERLGDLLGAFGYVNSNIERGPTQVRIDARWDGAPSEFSLGAMRGTLRVVTGPGRLLEVSTGAAGRMFGLLSLSSLPRRLRLDFGDLFGEGFAFERIEGSFALDGGNAYTNDLTIAGTAARVDIAGRTGLVSQDYDQFVTVTPRFASTLPLAGAVLGPIGVGVGTVIWLAEKMFKQPLVDQVAAVRYTITGPWDDPRVEAVEPPAREDDNVDERG